MANQIKARREKRISTSKLNKIMLPELERTPPPAIHGKDLRINYITQVRTEPQVFAVFCNFPNFIPDLHISDSWRTLSEGSSILKAPPFHLFSERKIKQLGGDA